jgi:uncharacterized protein
MMNVSETNCLDISKLFSGEVREIPFDIQAGLPSFEENEISVSSLSFSGRAFDLSGTILLSGVVTAVMEASCARCLAPVRQDFLAEVEYSIVESENDSEEDTWIAEGETIDLAAMAEEIVLIRMPLRLLCKEDCQGLCPSCGKDLNDGPCQCDRKEIDPRLAGLADFFK